MIDTNSIAQAAQDAVAIKSQLSPWLPAIGIAAAWAGRELRNFNQWIDNLADKVIAHGGIKQIIAKLWNNPVTK